MRMDRVNQQLKRVISEILQRELQDPRFTFVTITSVNTSKDLRYAKVYFSVLGNPQQTGEVQKKLENARGLIRKYISQQLMIRYIPELSFVYDNSVEISERIEKTLKEIHDDLQKDNPSNQTK